MTGFSTKVRQLVRQRAMVDDFLMCEVMVCCQGRAAYSWQWHHRRPRAAGGSKRPETNEAANCLAVCGDCHSYIEIRRTEALEKGWLVGQRQDPASVPVLRRREWVLLDNNGGFTPCVCGEIETPGGWYPNMCRCEEEQ